ncbi:putative outer membrane secretion protein [Parvularcula bermudensis HTCC2503]|uniref:Putative outer membrane secretion protein n=2 Tax=Parvularcula TaxID=208215 RepID=E0TFS0_PARBH|nr:putative outer membrane secretion protein [Parvularcula bermudensis HTCC2503]
MASMSGSYEETNALLYRLLDTHPQLSAAETARASEAAALRATQRRRLPSVALTVGAGTTEETVRIDGLDGALTDSREPVGGRLTVSQPLFTSGVIGGAIGAAKARLGKADLTLDATRQDLLFAGAEAMATIVRDRTVLEARLRNEDVLAQRLEESWARQDVGLATVTDVQQSRSRSAQATANRVAAEGALAVSEARFERIFGFPAPASLQMPVLPEALPESLDDAIGTALEISPDYARAGEEVKAARATLRARRGQLLPQLALTAEAAYQDDQRLGLQVAEAESYSIMVEGRWDIFDGGAGYARAAAAQQDVGTAMFQEDDSRRALQEQVAAAFHRHRVATASLLARRAQRDAASSAAEGVAEEYLEGRRTRLDVLDADRELSDAEVAVIAAEAEEVTAGFALLRAMGAL